MLMEGNGGSGFSVVSNGIRKKRSDAPRRPRHDSQILIQSNVVLPASTEPFSSEIDRQNQNSEDKVVLYNLPRSENKLRKLKLKVGGVTRTIHNKSSADFSERGSSTIKTHSSSADLTPQEKPLLQVKCSDMSNHLIACNREACPTLIIINISFTMRK